MNKTQNKRMQFSPSVKTVSGILNDINNVERMGLDLQPSFQREYIWKDDFKDKLIYSVVRGYPIGNISIGILNSANEKNAMSEIVDGQQRLTCLHQFVEKEYEVKHEYARRICEDVTDYLINETDEKLNNIRKKLASGKKFKLTYKMLPNIIKNNILNYQLSISNISESTSEQISEYFKFLQNQEILRAGEMINSIPETNFKVYLEQVDTKEKFLSVIGFNKDNRREFDKLFYGALGVLDKSINFGCADKSIKSFVTENDGFLSEESDKKAQRLIIGINKVCLLDDKTTSEKSKRFIKFLFLLLGFDLFTFENSTLESSLMKLSEINKRLSAFTSSKKNILEETFSIFEKTGNLKTIVEEYRQISLFSRGSHSHDTTSEKIKLLNQIVSRELKADYLSR